MTFPLQKIFPFCFHSKSHQQTMYDPTTPSYNHHNLSYSNWDSTNFVEKDRKQSQKHEDNHINWYDHHMKSDHSGVTSPPLWKNSAKSPSHPLLSHHNHRPLSPNSRLDAIARGQWELMEMVKNMPETAYELTLKDIVEHHRVENQAPQTGDRSVNNNQNLHRRAVVKVKREESKKFNRNLSFENKGLFLNMVFPFSFKSKKKKKFGGNNSGKVSPKPEGMKGGGDQRDWWKKKFTGSSDSDSSRTSNNSGSSRSGGGGSGGGSSSVHSDIGGRKSPGFFTGCGPFFHSSESKSAE